MKKIRAKSAIVLITMSELVGKSVAEKPGTRPSTVGPSTMPASISPTTAGCRMNDSALLNSLDSARITNTCPMKSANGLPKGCPSMMVPVEAEPSPRARLPPSAAAPPLPDAPPPPLSDAPPPPPPASITATVYSARSVSPTGVRLAAILWGERGGCRFVVWGEGRGESADGWAGGSSYAAGRQVRGPVGSPLWKTAGAHGLLSVPTPV